jgi:ABC-type sugar transport system ATPase subunit
MALLEVDEIVTAYGSIEALKGVTLKVDEGEVVTLIGSNGAGKSTTLRSISGLTPPKSGSIRYRDQEISTLPAQEIVRLGISQSPEGRRCFQRMTVRENLELGAYLRRDANIQKDLDRVMEGGHDVRWRAADARHGASAHGRPLAPAPRRALDGTGADPRGPHLRDRRRDQQAGHDDPARRAERELRAGGLRARVRAGDR